MDYILILFILIITINQEVINKLTEKPLVGLLIFSSFTSIYIFFESLKYQMIFVYIYYILMISLFIFLSFLNINNKKYKIQKNIFIKISYLILFISIIFIIALPINFYIFNSGEFNVGTEVYQLENIDRNFQDEDYRKLKLRFFYPIENKGDKKDNLFVDNKPVDKLFDNNYSKKIYNFLNDLKINAFLNTKITEKKDNIEPIIISHKKGFLSEDYIMISQILASKGYFVIAIDHIFYSEYSFLEGDEIFALKYENKYENIHKNYKKDILDTISFLKQINKKYSYKIDLNKITLLGHGVGGEAAIDIASDDLRIRKVIALESDNFKKEEFINKNLNVLLINSNSNLKIVSDKYEYSNVNSEMLTSRIFLKPFSYISYILGINKLSEIHKLEIDFIKKY
ncbi:MAG: hypothetical protein ACQEQE_05240 [Bacillota bacterium]